MKLVHYWLNHDTLTYRTYMAYMISCIAFCRSIVRGFRMLLKDVVIIRGNSAKYIRDNTRVIAAFQGALL